jgi:6-phosphofructo-2-kinase/fructose-2,6-biphosphatase 4
MQSATTQDTEMEGVPGQGDGEATLSLDQRISELAISSTSASLRLAPQAELDDGDSEDLPADSSRTAEIAANAPRYRRRSSTFIDGIHDQSDDQSMAPAQLYSTMSGRLFHSGRIAIVMVGLPARGKTYVTSSLPLGETTQR